MTYTIRKNWAASFELMVTKPIVILPFIIIAFLEGLALELIYYFPRKPLANIAAPVIRRFFGEVFLHYPGNLAILPRLFYFAQIGIYVVCGVMLMGISVNILQNVRMGLALHTGTLIKNALKRYPSFLLFGITAIALMFCLRQVATIIFFKVIDLIAIDYSHLLAKLPPFLFALFLFFLHIVLQTFLVLTIPLLVIKKRWFLRALAGSIGLGFKHFGGIFSLIFWPFLIYLPIILLKADLPRLVNTAFPEITLWITAGGLVLAIFVECFVILCAAQFLLDVDKAAT